MTPTFPRTAALTATLDTLLQRAVGPQPDGSPGVPGVVALVTDRDGTVYEGAAGTRHAGTGEALTPDAVLALFSTTKPLTGVCALQLVEEGALRLADEAGRYVPEIDALQVLTGWDADGQPLTRPPRRRITVADLMLHTSGLSYEFFSADDLRYRRARGVPPVARSRFESIQTVLLHDPGEAFTYGVGIDWLGRVVEHLRGQRLGEVMQQRLFAPLGMQDIGFSMTPAMQARRAALHGRDAEGRVTVLSDRVPPEPAMDMGGQGLYGPAGEYMKFIRMILNDGAGPHGRVLQPATVALLAQDGLAPQGLRVGGWTSSQPALSRSGEFLPGIDKGWAHTFMTNRQPAPSGRPAGALMWSGLANLYFWIDRHNGLGGFWAAQLLPFQDAVAYPAFVDFEAAVYAHRPSAPQG